MENLTSLKGYTVISNQEYADLIMKVEKASELDCELFSASVEIDKLKRIILEGKINESNLEVYGLKGLQELDHYSNLFGYNLDELLKLGFAYDELMEFIKEKKEEYDRKIGTSNESLQE